MARRECSTGGCDERPRPLVVAARIDVRGSCWRLLPALVFTLLALFTRPGLAAEPYQDFLRGLWDRGYGEESLAYLTQIHQRSDLPTAMRETFDLSLARSLPRRRR